MKKSKKSGFPNNRKQGSFNLFPPNHFPRSPMVDEKISLQPILLDEKNETSLFNLVPTWAWDRFKSIPEGFLKMDARELRKQLNPGLRFETIRASFWVEYNSAISTNRKMVMARVHAGICTDDYFYNYIMTSPMLLAWILIPPENYQKALEAILVRSTERLYEIVNQDFYNTKGNLDPRIMQIVLQAHKHIEDRVKGSVVQKAEFKSLNMNINREVTALSEDDFERKIRDLKARERKALGQFNDGSGSSSSGEGEAS
jgi:hypothetical protein